MGLDDGVPFSASMLKSNERCGELFRLKYVERLGEMGTESIHLKVGNAVHEPIETVLQEGFPTHDKELLAERFTAEYRRGDWGIEDDDADEKVIRCLENAAMYLADQLEGEVSGIELPVWFHHAEVDRDFRGYIDIASEGPDRVVDWKTGTSEDKDLDETLQGIIYVAGYYALYGRLPESVVFVYLDEGKMVSMADYETAWDEMTTRAKALVAQVEQDALQPKPDDSKCYHCEYEVHCTVSDLGGGNVDMREYP